MAIQKGEPIKATDLNTINNGTTKSWSWGHAGWSWQGRYVHWYCTKPSGEIMMVNTNKTSTGNQKQLTLWRLENGSWVQKNYSDTASGTKVITFNSYGLGAYRLYLTSRNNTPSLQIWTSTTHCNKGELLTCISDGPTGPLSGGDHSESSVKFISGRARGLYLTANWINHGAVYTTAS